MNATTNGAVTKDKGEMCLEGWRALGGGASAEDVQAWVQQKYNVEVSPATVRKMKPNDLKRGGKNSNGNGGITATELWAVRDAGKKAGGLDKFATMVGAVAEAAGQVGGLKRLRAGVEALRELVG